MLCEDKLWLRYFVPIPLPAGGHDKSGNRLAIYIYTYPHPLPPKKVHSWQLL